MSSDQAFGLAVGLGIGLLTGAERERRKGDGSARAVAGVRTFALVALLGGVSSVMENQVAFAVAAAFVALIAIVGYAMSGRSDPGITTEVALFTTFLLGALAVPEPTLAAAIGVTVTVLLAARTAIHGFVSSIMSQQELHDVLAFAAAALVIWPLVPDRAFGPYDAINPFNVWRLVVLTMGISGAGYIAIRSVGPRFGLPIAGFAAGFVSSAATIGAMGGRARRNPSLLTPAVAGAVWSSVATIVQMVIVVGITDRETLRRLALPLAFAAIVAVAYGAFFALRAARTDTAAETEHRRAFDLRGAGTFALLITAILFLSAAAADRFGATGLVLSSAAAGFADTHAAAVSAASLAARGLVAEDGAILPVLVALSTNAITKVGIAVVAGPRRYAFQVGCGIAAMIAAAWAGLAASALY